MAELLIGGLLLLTDELKPIVSHGTGVFTYIYHKKSTIHVGKICLPYMDGMGNDVSNFFGPSAGDSTCWNCFGCSGSHGGRVHVLVVLKRVVTALSTCFHCPCFFFFGTKICWTFLNWEFRAVSVWIHTLLGSWFHHRSSPFYCIFQVVNHYFWVGRGKFLLQILCPQKGGDSIYSYSFTG